MFITNHVVSGAAIGLVLEECPLAAFCAGVASHFALDAVPHWGLAAGPDREDHFLRVARRDGVVGLVLAGGILLATPRRRRLSVATGIAGAVLPDMDKPIMHFFGRMVFPGWFHRFHAGIQVEDRSHLGNEVAAGAGIGMVVGALVWLARRG
jgi:hypothetical protein